MSIADARQQLEVAHMFARQRVDFIVVPVVSPEQKRELAGLALKNLDAIEDRQSESDRKA